MAIRLNKGQTVLGVEIPAGAFVFGLPPDVEAVLTQGGDASDVPGATGQVTSGQWQPLPKGFMPQFFVTGGPGGGSYSFVTRLAPAGDASPAEAGTVAAGATDGVLVVADGVDEINITLTNCTARF